ncbi:MAG: TIGR00159 family protein [Chloroflexi bacterium HGW-Chloroflexi-8]|nr:MAG: TIGR00159 family protein [Chloroflexi bacterium HGW-Chloroflexi-8]
MLFIFQRLDWLSVIDIALVTVIFFGILILLRDTQATVLLRGVVFLVILLALLTSFVDLPAFSWLIQTTLPALLLAIPVIFAPEIRRGLERLGRAGTPTLFTPREASMEILQKTMRAIATACTRLSARRHGALIVLQRFDSLKEYISTGVHLDADVTPELLLQIFYPNTPLHDGAVIVSDHRIVAASCVMPLSASGILNRGPERQMGLRHRAALGTSEASDGIVVVVSEETGSISVAQGGKMIRGLDSDRLENMLVAFYRPMPIVRDSINIFGWKIKLPQRNKSEEE